MLKINNLHAQIEDKKILNGVNLNIKAGEIHAIMGPNGSGKSTLASVIAGKEDYEITKGEMLFNDNSIDELSAEERAHKGIFMSFQYPIEIPGVTITNFIKTAISTIVLWSDEERIKINFDTWIWHYIDLVEEAKNNPNVDTAPCSIED